MRCVPSSYLGIALRTFVSEFSSPVIRGHIERRPDYVVQPGDRVCIKCLKVWTQRNNTPRVYKCRRVKCILCDTEKCFTRLVHSNYIGSTIKNLPLNISHDATNDAGRARIQSIQDYVVQRGDRVCNLCVEKNASVVVYASRDCSFAASRSHATENVATDARKTLLVATALSKDAKRGLTHRLKLETAGWDFPAQDVVNAPIGRWWQDVCTDDHGSRLQRLETHAANHPALAAALDVLKSHTHTIGVEEDARKTLLVASALIKDAKRGLTQKLKLETAGWGFPAQDVMDAPVGEWWSNVHTSDHGSRLQRLETHAAKHPNVAAALDVLKSYTPTIGVEEDARKTLLVATALSKDPIRGLKQKLKLETAGWDFPTQDVVNAPVGKWWSNVHTPDHGSRLQRLEMHAANHPDVAAALDVLKSRTKKRHT